MKTPLTFDALRDANLRRCDASWPECIPWTAAQWLQALVGEVGEYANWRKKFERGDITHEAFIREAAKELADVQAYLDLLADELGINLGEATRDKFNEVSDRVGSTVRL